MSYKKTICLLLALILLIGTLAGCGKEKTTDPEQSPEASDNGGTTEKTKATYVDDVFTLNCNKQYSFNPMTASNVSNILVTQLMYDELVTVDANYNWQPNIVTECKSDDGICWYFTVDTSRKFSDGSAVTAYDAAYSVQKAVRSPQYAARLSCLIGCSASSESVFVINIYGSNTRFPVRLNIPLIKDGTAGNAIPLGTGPYVLNEELTELTANEYYKDGASLPIDKIYLTELNEIEDKISAFEDGRLDLVTNDPTAFTNLGYGSANEKRSFPTTNMHYIGFNLSGKYFSNTLFRKAMTYIIDRESIVTDIMNGMATPATLPFHPACDYYNENFSEIISYSVSKCESILDEAEVQDYDNDEFREIMVTGIPVETDIDFIVCTDSTYKIQAARAIVANMQDLGLKVTLRELGWDEYRAALTAGEFDMYYAETKLTADFNLKNLLLPDGALNYGGIDDEKLTEYIDAYLSATDEDRQKAADYLFKYLTDTAPIVAICFEKQQVVTHSGIVTGIKPTQYSIFNGIDGWTINMD